jgi:hypothetical protein
VDLHVLGNSKTWALVLVLITYSGVDVRQSVFMLLLSECVILVPMSKS